MMCNMSKSKRTSRPEYNLCKIKNTSNTENTTQNDLKSAWIHPRSSGSDAPLHNRRNRSKLHALQTCPWHRTSFRQSTSQRTRRNEHVISSCIARQPVLRAVHVFLDPNSFDTVYSELWLSGFSVSSRDWNHPRCSQPVSLNR